MGFPNDFATVKYICRQLMEADLESDKLNIISNLDSKTKGLGLSGVSSLREQAVLGVVGELLGNRPGENKITVTRIDTVIRIEK